VQGLVGFALAFLENIRWENNMELLQGNVTNGLDAKKFKDKVWVHMVKFHKLGSKEETL
jgi:hypothetical protein